MNVSTNRRVAPESFSWVPLARRKAAEDSRIPRRYREVPPRTKSARSWSAAVLCRFFSPFASAQSPAAVFPCALLLFILAFTGCQSLRPVTDLTRYYVLSASAAASTRDYSNQALTIGIAPPELPGYLQNSRIAVRTGTNEINYSEYRQWAEHLDKGIQRVLASDLSTLLPSARVISSAWQSGDVKAEVYVSFQRFELDQNGDATLECEWRILSPGGGRVLRLDHALINKKGPPLANNPTGAVHSLSEALADLGQKIAAALPGL
jgi:uncharacterized lipoprotein YmbA